MRNKENNKLFGGLSSLTDKQRDVYLAIKMFIEIKGYPPTVREIGKMVGEKTPGAIQGILHRLESKGVIVRVRGLARSIRLCGETEGNQASSAASEGASYIPEVESIDPTDTSGVVKVQNIKKYHPISSGMLNCGDDCFMVQYPSTNSTGNNEGKGMDMLIVSKTDKLNDADVALVAYNGDVLLRHYFTGDKEGSSILKISPDSNEEDLVANHEFDVIGKVVGRYTRFE